MIFSIGLILCQYHYQSNAEGQQLTMLLFNWLLEASFLSTTPHHLLTVPVLLGHMSRPSLHEYNVYYSTFQCGPSLSVHSVQRNKTFPRRTLCKNMSSKVDQTSWTWLLNNDERNDSPQFYVLPTFQVNDIVLDHTGMNVFGGSPMMGGPSR